MAVTTVKSKQQLTVTADVAFGNFKITGLADPVNPQDGATKAYVDAARTGLDVKASVRAASTGNISITYTATSGTSTRGQITAAPNTLDGVTLAANDRILLKDQTSTGAQNGIYVVTTVGTGANGVWDRATDFDADAEVTAGAFTFVEEGTINADTGWVLTTNNPITIGGASGTVLTWVLFSSAGSLIAGNGLTKTGNSIDVVGTAGRISVAADSIDIDVNYVGQSTITTLGTVGTGTWNASTIATTKGGTGLTSYVLGDILYASAANTLAALAGNTLASKRFLAQTGNGTISAAPVWSAIVASDIGSGAALTKTDDTNVTLTLGGSPTTALLAATSLTLGWTGTLSAARGGTGLNTSTAANGQLLIGNGTGFALATLTQGTGITITNGAGTISIANGGVTSITGTTNQVTASASTGAVTLSLPQNIHTGATPTFAGLTLTAGTVTVSTPYISNTQTWNAGAVTFTGELINITDTASAAASKFLEYQVAGVAKFAVRKDGAIVTGSWAASTIAATVGGTGQTSYAVGDLLYADTTTSLAKLADVATGKALVSGGVGVAPNWGLIGLTSHVTGILPVANGGIGVNASTASNGQLPIGNGTGFTLATLTQGTGITITNGAGTITIAASSSGLGLSNFVVREVPSGAIDGSNAAFTLTNTPATVSNGAGSATSEQVYVNGVLQNVGASNDYTISGAVITFTTNAKPQTGDVVLVSYLK